MGEAARPRPGFGEGPLSRAAALVYTLIVVELLLLATTLPGLVPLVLLARDVSNAPLAALCLLPLGPALSAALYALHGVHQLAHAFQRVVFALNGNDDAIGRAQAAATSHARRSARAKVS